MNLFVRFCFYFVFLFWHLSVLPLAAQEASPDPRLKARLDRYVSALSLKYPEKPEIGIHVLDISSGRTVYSYGGGKLMTPASTLKIITTYAALKILGSDYQFPTEIFVDALPTEVMKSQGSPALLKEVNAGNLYVRGYGDPTMVQERLREIAEDIHRRGITAVRDLVIDDGLFIDPPRPVGEEAYEAGLGAVSLNFNSYAVSVAPSSPGFEAIVSLTPGLDYKLLNRVKTKRGKGRKISIIQTPTSVGYRRPIEGRGDFSSSQRNQVAVTVQGTVGLERDLDIYYRSVPDVPLYFGEVFRHFLIQAGVEVKGRVRVGETTGASRLLMTLKSKPLSEILRDLNHNSNNFIAGQLIFAMGQDSVGYFRMDIGIERVKRLLEDLGIPGDAYRIFDGSGLDRRNSLTTAQITAVLRESYNDFSIAPDLIASLSRFGHSGTLDKRVLFDDSRDSKGTRREVQEKRLRADGVWAKTGTLTGVSSLAGYAAKDSGDRLAFAIIISGNIAKAKATDIEDGLVRLLIGLDK